MSAAFAYAVVNAFGAWMVQRRKLWVAVLFMIAAALLLVSVAAIVGVIPYAKTVLALGLIAASVASFINAHIVLGNVVWRFHVLRAAIGGLVYYLATLAL